MPWMTYQPAHSLDRVQRAPCSLDDLSTLWTQMEGHISFAEFEAFWRQRLRSHGRVD